MALLLQSPCGVWDAGSSGQAVPEVSFAMLLGRYAIKESGSDKAADAMRKKLKKLGKAGVGKQALDGFADLPGNGEQREEECMHIPLYHDA